MKRKITIIKALVSAIGCFLAPAAGAEQLSPQALDPSEANAIACEAGGGAYVAGLTYSTSFPVVNPYQSSQGGGTLDAFVVKLSSTGSYFLYSTYLGGEGDDEAHGIYVENGQASVAGWTTSSDFPVKSAYQSSLSGPEEGYPDGFISRLSSSGSVLIYSTYLGGASEEMASGGSSSRTARPTWPGGPCPVIIPWPPRTNLLCKTTFMTLL